MFLKWQIIESLNQAFAFVVALLGRGVWDRHRPSTGGCWAGYLVWSSVLCCFSSVLWLFHLLVWRILSLIGPLIVLYCLWFWSLWWVHVWCEFWLWGLYLFSWSLLDSFLILHFGSGRRGFRLAMLYHRPSVRPGIWCMLGFFSSRIYWIVWSRIMRWSQVALPVIPPAWPSVSWTCFFTLSLMIRSYNFPGLLARVIPPSFEQFPLIPFPLYSRRMCPSCQLSGISSSSCIPLSAVLNISLVSLFASMNVLLGISSGPRLFFLLSFFKEICTLLVKLHIIWSRMQRVNLHVRPSIIQMGCPTLSGVYTEPCKMGWCRPRLPLRALSS